MNKLRQLINQANSVKGATVILVVTLFISNILGLIRDHFLAQKIPTSMLDTYYAAFRIPDFIFNLFILGAIAAAFIPVFTKYRTKKEEEAWHITNSFLNIAVIIVIISAMVLYFVMPQLIGKLVADFSLEKQELTTKFARILLFSPFFFSLSYIFGGVLNSYKRFFVYSLAPLIYNMSIIFATIFFADKYGVVGVVYGVVIGAALHLLVQIPITIKLGYKYKFVLDWKHSGVKEIIYLMVPRSIGLGAMQAMLLFYTSIAATLGAGSVAIFNLADNIQTMPIVVFGTSFATALFPSLSLAASDKKLDDFSNYLLHGLRSITFILIPASLGIIMLRSEIVRVILGSGHFGWQQTIDTANVLGVFAISLTAQGIIPLLSRAFYALHNTKTPTIISVISIVISISLGYTLSINMGVLGLALAFAIGSLINFILLYIILRQQVPLFIKLEKDFINFIGKVLFATAIMVVAIQLSKIVIGSSVDMQRYWGVLTKIIFTVAVGGSVYLYICHLLKCEEINEIKIILAKKFGLNGLESNDK